MVRSPLPHALLATARTDLAPLVAAVYEYEKVPLLTGTFVEDMSVPERVTESPSVSPEIVTRCPSVTEVALRVVIVGRASTTM